MKAAKQNIVQKAHPSQAALDAIVTLRLYSAGKANTATALWALRRLEYIYGPPVKSAVALFRRGLEIDDRQVQKEILFEALSHLIDWVFRDQVQASLWQAGLQLSRSVQKKIRALIARLPVAGDFTENYFGLSSGLR